jgi:uncharacterized coiled-coil protein SlyX
VEPNGGRLNDHEDRIARLEAARKELEDSFIIMTHLETKSAARMKEHAEFIAQHQQVIREIDEKLNALIDVVGKMQGGIESRPS